MALKISKADRTELDALAKAVSEKQDSLTSAIEDYNNATADPWEKVEEQSNAYNEALQSLKEKIESIHGDIDSEIDDKSERWQEGEKGEAARSWASDIEDKMGSLDEIELSKPDDIEDPDFPDVEDATSFSDDPSNYS